VKLYRLGPFCSLNNWLLILIEGYTNLYHIIEIFNIDYNELIVISRTSASIYSVPYSKAWSRTSDNNLLNLGEIWSLFTHKKKGVIFASYRYYKSFVDLLVVWNLTLKTWRTCMTFSDLYKLTHPNHCWYQDLGQIRDLTFITD